MAEAEGEGEAVEGGKKKGGMKGLIIKIVPLLLIALIAAKMTVLKPPPPTKAQVAQREAQTKYDLDYKCAQANSLPLPKAPKGVVAMQETTPTTMPDPAGPVLELDSKTLNLDGSHFLKIGVSLQLPAKAVPDTVKITDNWSSIASQLALDTFTGRSFAELSNDDVRIKLEHQIGNEECEKTDGQVVTVYFIDFVMQ